MDSKFCVQASILVPNTMVQEFYENLKFSVNFGKRSESHQYGPEMTLPDVPKNPPVRGSQLTVNGKHIAE